jgi:type I restriction enzyme S subunit
VYYLTRTHLFKVLGEAFMIGAAGQKRVPKDFIENFILGVPPYQEQKRIAENIHQNSIRINNSVQKIQTQINLLKEYRQSLIFEAVTGKMDVREIT